MHIDLLGWPSKYYFPNATLPPKKIYIHIASLRRLSLRQLMSYTFTPFIRLPFLGLPSLKVTASLPLKPGRAPKRNASSNRQFSRVMLVSGRVLSKKKKHQYLSYFRKFHLPSISYHQFVGVNSMLVSRVCFNHQFE